jgi:hypothetical protein
VNEVVLIVLTSVTNQKWIKSNFKNGTSYRSTVAYGTRPQFCSVVFLVLLSFVKWRLSNTMRRLVRLWERQGRHVGLWIYRKGAQQG